MTGFKTGRPALKRATRFKTGQVLNWAVTYTFFALSSLSNEISVGDHEHHVSVFEIPGAHCTKAGTFEFSQGAGSFCLIPALVACGLPDDKMIELYCLLATLVHNPSAAANGSGAETSA